MATHNHDPYTCREGGEAAKMPPKWMSIKPWNRHGLILTIAGLAYILIGIGYVISNETPSQTEVMKFAFLFMPYTGWGIGFIVVGCIAAMSSRWPSLPRTLGYSTLTGWTSAWAGFHVVGGLSQHATHLSYVAGGLAWGMMAFLWWAISGLICPPKERGVSGRAAPYRESSCRFDCGIVRRSNPTDGIEGESQRETGSFPSQHGDGSLRTSSSVRHRNYIPTERDHRGSQG